MHVCENVLPLQKRIEQAAAVIALDEEAVFAVAGGLQKVRPDFQHASGLKIEDVVHLLAGAILAVRDKPVRKPVRHRKRLAVPRQAVHIHKPHEGLVHGVVRRPDLLAPGNPCKIFLRNRRSPLPAVFLLAARQLMNDGVGLRLQLPVAGLRDAHGAGT